jgi:hypothetical protein
MHQSLLARQHLRRPVQTLTTSQSANEDGKERFINEKTLNKMDGEIRNG